MYRKRENQRFICVCLRENLGGGEREREREREMPQKISLNAKISFFFNSRSWGDLYNFLCDCSAADVH